MKRVHLFEFEDLPQLPNFLRNYVTELLSHQLCSTNTYEPITEKLADAVARSSARRVIDLCSGGGGPSMAVFEELGRRDPYLSLVLTDKYPNIERFKHLAELHPRCAFEPMAVDAQEVPESLTGFRVIFTAFHHFKPEAARAIIQDSINRSSPIAIFEFTERSLGFFLTTVLFAPLLALIMTPAVRPRSLGRFLWTYLLPVMPLVHSWDGIVSGLRTYDPEELDALVQSTAGHDAFDWEIGRTERGGGFRITYLLGLPKQAS